MAYPVSSGVPQEVKHLSSNDSESSDILKLNDDEGWEDAEAEDDQHQIISLLDNGVFSDVSSMLTHCKSRHGFDFMGVRTNLNLDFYGTIKLVNYIRSLVKAGKPVSSSITKAEFEDDTYLKPVIEDDAFLFSLDDLPDTATGIESTPQSGTDTTLGQLKLINRVAELEVELRRTQSQFSDYRDIVKRTLEDRWSENGAEVDSSWAAEQSQKRDDDSHYFNSYSYNDIHETMLKDTVRTDAYRDFIYNNKHLFAGKVVLDVGCGTGILSLLCAKAGAICVIAVDNSNIIDKARENVFNNGLSEKITCLRGKVEEVHLPVQKVDIIVSEWMGYCLLYEAMLDSVIWARDRYLKPEGLMVPSHMNMWIAPVSDPQYVMDHISFWRDVYGFDMKAMQTGIHNDAQVIHMPPSTLCTNAFPFLQLTLHSTAAKDLVFKRKWHGVLNKSIDTLDGFVIWFDAFFMPSRAERVPDNAKAGEWSGKGVAFTTGPDGKETHWRQGVLFVDNISKANISYKQGDIIDGELEYSVPAHNSRALNLRVSWTSAAGAVSQSWKMK